MNGRLRRIVINQFVNRIIECGCVDATLFLCCTNGENTVTLQSFFAVDSNIRDSRSMQAIEDIHIGDEVRFLDSVGGGRVARIDANKHLIYIEDEDGFEIPTPLQQIVTVQPARQAPVAHTQVPPTPRDVQEKAAGTATIPSAIERRAKGKKEAKREDIQEVDLHISALADNWQSMERSEMLHLQMDVFRRTMRDNIRYKGKKIVFIHGRGEGVLKAAIGSELRQHYPNCEYQDASFAQYGFGATMVIIK